MKSNFTVIIPARYASTRLPGKILLPIAGKPMIEHVYRQAQLSSATKVIVATDDQRIADAVEGFSGTAVMTSAQHNSGTDRLQEVCEKLALADDEIIVNVQGDEPLIPPTVIDQVAQLLIEQTQSNMATLCAPINDAHIFFDPNAVKVVCNRLGRALYFSRASIPYPRDLSSQQQIADALKEKGALNGYCLRHIGIYAYRVKLLHQFVTWPQAPLETLEKLEQLRVLWQGESIQVAQAAEFVPPGVDSEEDLNRVKHIIANKA